MLFKFYSAIKTQLVAEVAALVGVEWFNNQYQATILKTPVCFVEFPEAQEPEYTKDMLRTPVVVRLHIVSKVLTKIDAAVSDTEVQAHELIAIAARNAIKGFIPTQLVDGQTVEVGTRLKWTRWQHFHKYNGYMVTTIDFTFKTSEFDG